MRAQQIRPFSFLGLSTLLVTEIIQFPLNKAGSARLTRLQGERHRDRQAEQNDPNNKK
jgi:hypothetical protein